MIRTKKKSSKKPLVIGLVVIVVALVAGAYIWHIRDNDSKIVARQTVDHNGNTAENSKNNIHYSSTSKTKTSTGSNTSTSSVNSGVSVFITSVAENQGNVYVRAYIAGIIQNGTCTFTFTQGASIITKFTEATPNVSTTNCTSLSVSASDFPSTGNWNVVVSYSSGTITASSPMENIDIN